MPFDPSGNFTRSYNWVTDKANGIKIVAARMDGEFDNYATAMNQTFLRNGVVPMTGNLKMNANSIVGLGDGSAGVPSIQANSDPTTGLYFSGVGKVSLTAGGVQRLEANATGLNFFGPVTGSSYGRFVQPNSAILGAITVVADATASGRFVFLAANGTTVLGTILCDSADGTLRFLAGNTVPFQLNVTPSGAIQDKNGYELGYKDLPQNIIPANYQIALTDRNKHCISSSSGGVGVLTNAAIPFPIGTVVTVINDGAVNMTIAGDVGVTLKLAGSGAAGNKSVVPGGIATLLKVAINTWYVGGPGVS